MQFATFKTNSKGTMSGKVLKKNKLTVLVQPVTFIPSIITHSHMVYNDGMPIQLHMKKNNVRIYPENVKPIN